MTSVDWLFSLILVHLWTCSSSLPLLNSVSIRKIPDQRAAPQQQSDDPLQSFLISSATCLFLGGTACPGGRIPVDASHQLDGKAKLGSAQGLTLPVLKPIFGSDNLGLYTGTDVNVGQPRVSTGTLLDVLGVLKSQQGVRDAGLRGNGNYGATWGDQTSVLGDLIGIGNTNDVNFNVDRLRLDQMNRNGVRGLYEETFRTVVDPFNLKAGRMKETCYARILFGGKGLCSLQDVGLASPS